MPEHSVDWDTRFGRLLRSVAMATAMIVGLFVIVIGTLLLWHTGFAFWQDVIKEHFLGSIGLIGISCLAFGIVIFLRQTEGPIEFEAMGLKLRGAAGQVILWALCVIVLSLCAKLLW
jgi:hypothetical protein